MLNAACRTELPKTAEIACHTLHLLSSKKIRKVVASKISYHKVRGSKKNPNSKIQVEDRLKKLFMRLLKADSLQILHHSQVLGINPGPVLPELPKLTNICHASAFDKSTLKSGNQITHFCAKVCVNLNFYPPWANVDEIEKRKISEDHFPQGERKLESTLLKPKPNRPWVFG